MTPQFRKVVSVRAVYLLDEAMQSEAFQYAGRLRTALVVEMFAQVLVLKTADVELAASDRFKQRVIFLIEEVESGIAALVINHGAGDFGQRWNPGTAIIQRGDEFDIPRVGRRQDLA